MKHILENPKQFIDKEVQLEGFISSNHFEDFSIWLSKECYEKRHHGHSIWIEYDFDSHTEEEVREFVNDHGKTVLLTGIINEDNHGHFGFWPLAISFKTLKVINRKNHLICKCELPKSFDGIESVGPP